MGERLIDAGADLGQNSTCTPRMEEANVGAVRKNRVCRLTRRGACKGLTGEAERLQEGAFQ